MFIIIDWDGHKWTKRVEQYETLGQAQRAISGVNSRAIHSSFVDCLDVWPSPEEMQEIAEDISTLESDNAFEEID